MRAPWFGSIRDQFTSVEAQSEAKQPSSIRACSVMASLQLQRHLGDMARAKRRCVAQLKGEAAMTVLNRIGTAARLRWLSRRHHARQPAERKQRRYADRRSYWHRAYDVDRRIL